MGVSNSNFTHMRYNRQGVENRENILSINKSFRKQASRNKNNIKIYLKHNNVILSDIFLNCAERSLLG